jgi:hypothetical protein
MKRRINHIAPDPRGLPQAKTADLADAKSAVATRV